MVRSGGGVRVVDGGSYPGERSSRHYQRVRRRRVVWWGVAALAWLALACLVVAAVDVPSVAAWPTGHQLRSADLELTAKWSAACEGAVSEGQGILRLEPIHVAAWVNRLVAAGYADPAVAVTLRPGEVVVSCRLKAPLGVRPVLTLALRPSLLGDSLFCAVDHASLGRCPLPLLLWRFAVRQLGGEAGWSARDGAVGYAWPVQSAAAAQAIEIGDLQCREGILEITLFPVRQAVDARR